MNNFVHLKCFPEWSLKGVGIPPFLSMRIKVLMRVHSGNKSCIFLFCFVFFLEEEI